MCMHTKFIGVAVTVALSCVVCHGSKGFPEPCNIVYVIAIYNSGSQNFLIGSICIGFLNFLLEKNPFYLYIYPVFQSIKEVSGLSTSYKPKQQFNN